jgi:predicted lipoprotein with Yx(FWY)xxD motif
VIRFREPLAPSGRISVGCKTQRTGYRGSVAILMKTLKVGGVAMFAFGCAAAITLAACGSSASKATVTPAAQPSGAAAATAPIAESATTAKFGPILVAADGMTLYTLTNNGTPIPCTGQCAGAWPPLVLPAGMKTPIGATGVAGLGTTTGSGRTQVTDDGLALYRFSGDRAAGDTNGDGISSFGGVWRVVALQQKAAVTAPATVAPETTPTTASSGGYGY